MEKSAFGLYVSRGTNIYLIRKSKTLYYLFTYRKYKTLVLIHYGMELRETFRETTETTLDYCLVPCEEVSIFLSTFGNSTRSIDPT